MSQEILDEALSPKSDSQDKASKNAKKSSEEIKPLDIHDVEKAIGNCDNCFF